MSVIGPFHWGNFFFKDWGWMILLCILSTAWAFFANNGHENTEGKRIATFYIFPIVVCVDHWNNF